ncbi:hypothetical protein [Euzebya tangerina]|uniref:hypothetical protein n=1 Tax=Euzebya tangerina TaxID=591198 RepID=UPI000E314045|nr:hypothetical protein [Euzebya tangerina]
MDDSSGWHEILVDGWGELVREAVIDRVRADFAFRVGILAAAVVTPDDAEAEWVEAVHRSVVDGIRIETGADIEELGSQAAWAPYEEVWQFIEARLGADASFESVPEYRVGQVLALLAELPPRAVLHAGGIPWPEEAPAALVLDGRTRVHVDGLFRWLATEDEATGEHRVLARALIALVRQERLDEVT